MDWTRLGRQAKRVIEKRGGPGSVKEDAQELEAIAEGEGTVGEKLKAAAKAIQEPGAGQERRSTDAPGRGRQPGSPKKAE